MVVDAAAREGGAAEEAAGAATRRRLVLGPGTATVASSSCASLTLSCSHMGGREAREEEAEEEEDEEGEAMEEEEEGAQVVLRWRWGRDTMDCGLVSLLRSGLREPLGRKLRMGLRQRRLAALSYALAASSSESNLPRNVLRPSTRMVASHLFLFQETPVVSAR